METPEDEMLLPAARAFARAEERGHSMTAKALRVLDEEVGRQVVEVAVLRADMAFLLVERDHYKMIAAAVKKLVAELGAP